MEAISEPGAPATPVERKKLCPENQELLQKWMEDILSRPTKPSADERKEIWGKILKRDPWYKLRSIEGRIHRGWSKTTRENQKNTTGHAANLPPSNFIIDVTKVIRALLCERLDPSDEHISAWAASLGIEDNIVKEYIQRLRDDNGTASGLGSSTRAVDASIDIDAAPQTPSREPGSPQSEGSIAVPHNGLTSPTILSPRGGTYASSSTATSPLVGPCSPAAVDSWRYMCGKDSVATSVIFAHRSPLVSALPLGPEVSNHQSRRSASPSGTATHNLSQTPAHPDVPMAHDGKFIVTPAQVSASINGLESNARPADNFPYRTTPPAMSATDAPDFAMVDGFEGSALVRDVAPDDNVSSLPSPAETLDDSDANYPTTTEEFNDKFKLYSDSIDSLLNRIRSARRDQMH
ncbi:hypothetical protein BD410DRAFT_189818 [Rickenella mellea]|uniref:Uncharacterized protein n=1 Tax=Rickenella mellea TaxID=50990 RepID=A0A4Y7Q6A5_9AGAM|nr:hypothetical protein BD410DRAFT_189818 [Rickenella mellea]